MGWWHWMKWFTASIRWLYHCYGIFHAFHVWNLCINAHNLLKTIGSQPWMWDLHKAHGYTDKLILTYTIRQDNRVLCFAISAQLIGLAKSILCFPCFEDNMANKWFVPSIEVRIYYYITISQLKFPLVLFLLHWILPNESDYICLHLMETNSHVEVLLT